MTYPKVSDCEKAFDEATVGPVVRRLSGMVPVFRKAAEPYTVSPGYIGRVGIFIRGNHPFFECRGTESSGFNGSICTQVAYPVA